MTAINSPAVVGDCKAFASIDIASQLTTGESLINHDATELPASHSHGQGAEHCTQAQTNPQIPFVCMAGEGKGTSIYWDHSWYQFYHSQTPGRDRNYTGI